MNPIGFTTARAAYMVVSALIALLGLFAAARATDTGFSLFGYGMMLFGCAFGFWMLKRGLDGWEAARHGA